MDSLNKIDILNIKVTDCSRKEFFRQIIEIVRSSQRAKIMYVNIHVFNSAWQDEELELCLNSAEIVYCDGEGIRLGARLRGTPLKERMTGADWIKDLCLISQQKGFSLYLLGGEKGVAESAAKELLRKYPALKISGTHQGYFPFRGEENRGLIREINRRSPHFLLVGMGTPLQEKWIKENFHKLKVNIAWSVGGLFALLSGKEKRAPAWMHKNGLEWLFRLVTQPRRMSGRYLWGIPLFFYRVTKERRKSPPAFPFV